MFFIGILVSLPNVPEEDGAVRASRREETLVNGMPRDGTCFLLVTAEYLNLFAELSDVKELQQVVTGCGYEPVSVVVPFEIHYS